MGKYDYLYIQEKDGIYEKASALYGGDKDIVSVYEGKLGSNFGISWGIIDKPHTMKDKPEVRDYESLMIFTGANLYNMRDFDAEIEFTLGGEKHIITETTFVRIPAFVEVGPVVIKRVGKSFRFTHVYHTAHDHVLGASEKKAPPAGGPPGGGRPGGGPPGGGRPGGPGGPPSR